MLERENLLSPSFLYHSGLLGRKVGCRVYRLLDLWAHLRILNNIQGLEYACHLETWGRWRIGEFPRSLYFIYRKVRMKSCSIYSIYYILRRFRSFILATGQFADGNLEPDILLVYGLTYLWVSKLNISTNNDMFIKVTLYAWKYYFTHYHIIYLTQVEFWFTKYYFPNCRATHLLLL